MLMPRAVVVAVLSAPILAACSSSPPALERSDEARSALDEVVVFRRGAGAIRLLAETCDERTDPRTHDTTVVRLAGLRPTDVLTRVEPSQAGDPPGTNVVLAIPGSGDVLTAQFFATRGEDCYSGIRELRFDGGVVWRSLADVSRGAATCGGACGGKAAAGCYCDDTCAAHGDCCPDKVTVCGAAAAGSCAGACGTKGSGGCYCDARCTRSGDCCGDYAPVCGAADLGRAGGITFPATGAPTFPGEDVSAGDVRIRYDYHRLIDAHPECVEHAPDGSAARIVMEVAVTGQPRFEKRYVAGYSTSKALPLAIDDTFRVPPVTRFVVAFRCGAARDDAGGAGYAFETIR